MKTKGKKRKKQAYSWSHYSPDVLNLGLEIDPSHKIWASLKQNRMFDFQDKIAHHIAWYRNAGGCLHMPENMIFNVNFSQVRVLIIMDVFFTLCYKPVWKYSEKYFKVKMKTPQTFISRPRNSDL